MGAPQPRDLTWTPGGNLGYGGLHLLPKTPHYILHVRVSSSRPLNIRRDLSENQQQTSKKECINRDYRLLRSIEELATEDGA